MNALVKIANVDTSTWFFDPESIQKRGCITLQKSLDDCEGYVVINWRTSLIVEAKDSWMVGLKTIITEQQEAEYDEFIGETA
ncbi:MAG: hypothetical protein H7Z73_12335 [Candidatus Saccharibacteria bacterium]|nr:hypothetical protein [Moraxellaceae bacterium]